MRMLLPFDLRAGSKAVLDQCAADLIKRFIYVFQLVMWPPFGEIRNVLVSRRSYCLGNLGEGIRERCNDNHELIAVE